LATELPEGHSADDMEQCIDLLVHLFGPDRLIWGSDWPVATTAIEYSDWLQRCREQVATHFSSYADAIFSGNAKRIYRLTRGEAFHTSGG
jgi:L-fuconolactonase